MEMCREIIVYPALGTGTRYRERRPAAPEATLIWTQHHDDALRAAYARQTPGAVARLAQTLGVDHKTLLNRAMVLRIPIPRRASRWQGQELALLSRHLPMGVRAAERALKAAGYKRSSRAIREKAQRYLGSAKPDDPDTYTPEDLAYHLGLHATKVRKLCEAGKLKAKVSRGPQGLPRYKVSRRAVRDYLIEWKAHVDHRRIDFAWAVDVLAKTRVRRKQDVQA